MSSCCNLFQARFPVSMICGILSKACFVQFTGLGLKCRTIFLICTHGFSCISVRLHLVLHWFLQISFDNWLSCGLFCLFTYTEISSAQWLQQTLENFFLIFVVLHIFHPFTNDSTWWKSGLNAFYPYFIFDVSRAKRYKLSSVFHFQTHSVRQCCESH